MGGSSLSWADASRLWFIIELHTFISIAGVEGGRARPFSKISFAAPSAPSAPPTQLQRQPTRGLQLAHRIDGKERRFEVTRAGCSDATMGQRLLAVIERSYPNLDDFNRVMATTLFTDEGVDAAMREHTLRQHVPPSRQLARDGSKPEFTRDACPVVV